MNTASSGLVKKREETTRLDLSDAYFNKLNETKKENIFCQNRLNE